MARESRLRRALAIGVLLVLLGVLVAQVVRSVTRSDTWAVVRHVLSDGGDAEYTVVRAHPQGLMCTEAELAVVAPSVQAEDVRAALERAEARLRDVEALMSVHLATSDLSRLNAAAAGETIEISQELSALLEMAGLL